MKSCSPVSRAYYMLARSLSLVAWVDRTWFKAITVDQLQIDSRRYGFFIGPYDNLIFRLLLGTEKKTESN